MLHSTCCTDMCCGVGLHACWPSRISGSFASYPLTITALSALFLGERVGWRRWAAVVAGLCGVIIAIQPDKGFFDLHTILPVVSALCFAAYGVLTRHAARRDFAETSFFWTGVGGAIGVSLIGPFFGFHLRPRLALDGGSLPNRRSVAIFC